MLSSRRSDLLDGILKGGLAGAVVAAMALGVGVIRIVVALASGRKFPLPSRSDLRTLAFYILGFMLAGSFLGIVWPRVRGKFAYYVAGSLAGTILMLLIALSDSTPKRLSGWVLWVGVVGGGTLFGCAFTSGIVRASEEDALKKRQPGERL